MIEPFELERFFAPYEHTARHVLCASDCETLRVRELLELDPELEERLRELPLGYSPVEGLPELRAAIAAIHQGVAPSDVVVLPGGGPCLDLTFRSLLAKGDRVVVLTPCYQSYLTLPRHLGCEVVEVPLDGGPPAARAGEEAPPWSLDLERLAAALRPGTRAVIVNFPHNPTGYQPDRETFRALVDLADAAGAHLVSDEVFRFLEHDPADRLPAGVEAHERGITLGALSKSFGLPGLRIGWVVARSPELLGRILEWNDYAAKDASAVSQTLALSALRGREAILERNLRLALRNLEVLDAFFQRNAERILWARPRVSVMGLARLRAGSADELFRRLFDRSGVLVAPGRLFGLPADTLRLGFGYRDLPEALELLERELTDELVDQPAGSPRV